MEDHVRKIAQLIIENNPDVINLVEVENLEVLNILNTKFLNNGDYKAYFVNGRDAFTRQTVGFLTRIKLQGSLYDLRLETSGNTPKTVSKNYASWFSFGQFKIPLIGLNFLLFPDTQQKKTERQAQAGAIRQMTQDKRAVGYALIAIGDFKDFDGDTRYSDTLSHLPIMNALEPVCGLSPDTTDDDLINASRFVAKANRYESLFNQIFSSFSKEANIIYV